MLKPSQPYRMLRTRRYHQRPSRFAGWWCKVQGDITSPLYFILALNKILRDHDSRRDKGITLGHTIIHTLEYADDTALMDKGDAEGIKIATSRLNETQSKTLT